MCVLYCDVYIMISYYITCACCIVMLFSSLQILLLFSMCQLKPEIHTHNNNLKNYTIVKHYVLKIKQ